MKKIYVLLFMLISTLCGATNINVINPGNNMDIRANLQSAVNIALNGDVVILPKGIFSITSSVFITKFISIKGQGIDSTIIYRSESTTDASLNFVSMFRFNINSFASSKIVVSGISLRSKKPSVVQNDGLSLAKDMGIEMINCVDFVITNCKFQYFGNGAVSITHDDSICSGLIYDNQFYSNYKGFDAMGLGYGVVVYGRGLRWVSDPQFGSSNFIFIEDNKFDYHRHSIASGGCAKYVARHNEFLHNIIAGPYVHCIDTHDARGIGNGSNTYGTRVVEVYSNQIINTTFINGKCLVQEDSIQKIMEKAIAIKSGDAVVYENFISGYRFGVGILSEHATGVYPYISQPGYISGLQYGSMHVGTDLNKGKGDLYVWGNTFSPYISTPLKGSVGFYNYSTTYFVADRDYHLFEKPNYVGYVYPHPLRIGK